MNSFDLEYSAATQDDNSLDAGDRVSSHLQSSLSSHDPSLMGYPNSYSFSDMIRQDFDQTLQSFDQPLRAQGDLEGCISNVILPYDAPITGMSMTMGLDSGDAFAYDIPTTYPATMMDLVPSIDDSQLQSAFPFQQSLSQAGQYLSQQQQVTLQRNTYNSLAINTTTNSIDNFDGSDLSMTSDRSRQLTLNRPVLGSQRFSPYGQMQQTFPGPYLPSQPVAIQPKKPIAALKGELPFCSVACSMVYPANIARVDATLCLPQTTSRQACRRLMRQVQSIQVSTRAVALMF